MTADATLTIHSPAGSILVTLPARGTEFSLYRELVIALNREVGLQNVAVSEGDATISLRSRGKRVEAHVPCRVDLLTTLQDLDRALATALFNAAIASRPYKSPAWR